MTEPLEGELFQGIASDSSLSLEDVIETDVLFASERPNRTLGRANWLANRSTAEFMILVDTLGFTMEQKVALTMFFQHSMSDWQDFMAQGIGDTEFFDHPGDRHPLDIALENAVDDKFNEWDDETSGDRFAGVSFEGSQLSDTLGGLEASRILELVRQLGAVSLNLSELED